MRLTESFKAKFDDRRRFLKMYEIADSKPPPGSIQNHLANRAGEIKSPWTATARIEKYGLADHLAKWLVTMTENHQIRCFLFYKHLEFPGRPSTVPDYMLNHNAPVCYDSLKPYWCQRGRIHIPRNTGDGSDAL